MKKFKLLTSVSLVLCLVFQLAGFHVPPFGITDVYAASSGIVDGNDTSIYYAGNWSEVSNQNYYNGSTKVSSRLADFVYFTFTGTESDTLLAGLLFSAKLFSSTTGMEEPAMSLAFEGLISDTAA